MGSFVILIYIYIYIYMEALKKRYTPSFQIFLVFLFIIIYKV